MEEWQKSETIVLWLLIGVSFLVLLLVFIIVLTRIMFKKTIQRKEAEAKLKLEYQQSLLDATIKTQEKERKRIAADLHDALISKLTVLKIKEGEGENEALIDESISIARRISHDLSPPLLEFSSLTDLIGEALEPWKQKMEVSYKVDIRKEINFSNDFKIQLTRVVQEILTNISKHAKAKEIHVHIRQSSNGLGLVIRDTGVGFKMDTKKKGLGLQNIETRIQYLKGEYKLKSEPGKGTTNIFYLNPKIE